MNRAFIITAIVAVGLGVTGCDLGSALDSAWTHDLHLLAPDGGEMLTVGTTYVIRWEGAESASVRIALSTDGGERFGRVISEDGQNNSFRWVVPDLPCDRCMIQITAWHPTGPNGSYLEGDRSDGTFKIHEP